MVGSRLGDGSSSASFVARMECKRRNDGNLEVPECGYMHPVWVKSRPEFHSNMTL